MATTLSIEHVPAHLRPIVEDPSYAPDAVSVSFAKQDDEVAEWEAFLASYAQRNRSRKVVR